MNIAVIPVRYGSTRFPGKPLALLKNRPLIYWVYSGVKSSKKISHVFVATDNQRIADAVKSFGGQVVMTGHGPRNGTERVAEAVATIEDKLGIEPEIIVNVQGDEPLITGDVVDQAVFTLQKDDSAWVGTIGFQDKDGSLYEDQNSVKVVIDRNQRALYFSRAPIPFKRNPGASVYIHAGIYAYRADALKLYPDMEPGVLEKSESLEQLRFLENGHPISVSLTDKALGGVDTPESLERVGRLLGKQ